MALKNKKVFITGISGFVGSHMAKYLLDEGANFLLSLGEDGWEPGVASASMWKKARQKGHLMSLTFVCFKE